MKSKVLCSGLTLCCLLVLAGPLHGSPITYSLRLFNTDDRLEASITNSMFSDELMLTNDFLGDTGIVDISSFVAPGPNTLTLRLSNVAGGYTYGYELFRDSAVIDDATCGTVNVVGCNDNDFTPGDVFAHSVTFGLDPIEDPLSLRLFNTDDTLQAFVTNSSLIDQLVLSNSFSQDTGFVDVNPFLRPGENRFHLELTNDLGGYTFGFQFQEGTKIVDEGSCGTAGVAGSNDYNGALGTVFTHTLLVQQAPEPASILLFASGLAALVTFRKYISRP